MLRHVRAAALALAAFCPLALAQLEANFQYLLSGLTQGTEVTLLTPLSDGTIEVTSFYPPGRMSGADAAAAIERARAGLANFGIEQPSGAQLAAALVGGTLNIPSGSTHLTGVLPPGPRQGTFRSQIVATQSLPQVVPPPGSDNNSAVGGTAPPLAYPPR